ncbi:MAG: hypothetical protein ACRDUY_12340 [Nitriliruptorales bacterium]
MGAHHQEWPAQSVPRAGLFDSRASEDRFLDVEVRDPDAEDLSVRCGVTERFEVRLAQRTFPDEQLVLDAPLEEVVSARAPLLDLRQSHRETADVIPGRHCASIGSVVPAERERRDVLRDLGPSCALAGAWCPTPARVWPVQIAPGGVADALA